MQAGDAVACGQAAEQVAGGAAGVGGERWKGGSFKEGRQTVCMEDTKSRVMVAGERNIPT